MLKFVLGGDGFIAFTDGSSGNNLDVCRMSWS
jgi:hypothetical protein